MNYANPNNPIGVPNSSHEGRLIGKGTVGKKSITVDDPVLLHKAHFLVLQQMSEVFEGIDEHKMVLK